MIHKEGLHDEGKHHLPLLHPSISDCKFSQQTHGSSRVRRKSSKVTIRFPYLSVCRRQSRNTAARMIGLAIFWRISAMSVPNIRRAPLLCIRPIATTAWTPMNMCATRRISILHWRVLALSVSRRIASAILRVCD